MTWIITCGFLRLTGRNLSRGKKRASRLWFVFCALVLLIAVGRLFGTMWQHRTALITADPFSYISFAQDLSGGHLHMTGPVADAAAAFSEAVAVAAANAGAAALVLAGFMRILTREAVDRFPVLVNRRVMNEVHDPRCNEAVFREGAEANG